MATNPIRPTNDEARALARRLINGAKFAAIGVIDNGKPLVTRIAIATDHDGCPLTLISDLSMHTRCLRISPTASLLLGEPEDRGDPLTHPRLTLGVRAVFIEKSEAQIARYLAQQPKAKLYIGFTDFHLVRLEPVEGHLNGGFGKAFTLTADDFQS